MTLELNMFTLRTFSPSVELSVRGHGGRVGAAATDADDVLAPFWKELSKA